MLENISKVIDERSAEALFPTPTKVIKRVVEIMENNKEKVLRTDYTDQSCPCIYYLIHCNLPYCTMAIEVELELSKDNIEI